MRLPARASTQANPRTARIRSALLARPPHESLARAGDRIAELPESLQDAYHVGTINPCFVTASGVRNHYTYEILDVFPWLAAQSTGVYGILFVQDDDTGADGAERSRFSASGTAAWSPSKTRSWPDWVGARRPVRREHGAVTGRTRTCVCDPGKDQPAFRRAACGRAGTREPRAGDART
jgi:hypothetical protein